MTEKQTRASPSQGRGRRSTIDLLPEDLRVELNAALRDGRLTQKEIVAQFNGLLNERDLKPLSYSAVNRYATNIEEQFSQMRAAREAANSIVGGLQEQPGGDIGRALTEIVKSLTFDVVMNKMASAKKDGGTVDPELLGNLALTLQRLEKAAKTGAEREMKIRQKAVEATKKAAATEVDNVAKEVGLSQQSILAIKSKILGVKVEQDATSNN